MHLGGGGSAFYALSVPFCDFLEKNFCFFLSRSGLLRIGAEDCGIHYSDLIWNVANFANIVWNISARSMLMHSGTFQHNQYGIYPIKRNGFCGEIIPVMG